MGRNSHRSTRWTNATPFSDAAFSLHASVVVFPLSKWAPGSTFRVHIAGRNTWLSVGVASRCMKI